MHTNALVNGLGIIMVVFMALLGLAAFLRGIHWGGVRLIELELEVVAVPAYEKIRSLFDPSLSLQTAQTIIDDLEKKFTDSPDIRNKLQLIRIYADSASRANWIQGLFYAVLGAILGVIFSGLIK